MVVDLGSRFRARSEDGLHAWGSALWPRVDPEAAQISIVAVPKAPQGGPLKVFGEVFVGWGD